MKTRASELVFVGLLLQWFCLWHKGLSDGFPYADHRRDKATPPPILSPVNRHSATSRSDAPFSMYTEPPAKPFSLQLSQQQQTGTSYHNEPKYFDNPNDNIQSPFSLYLQKAYMPNLGHKTEPSNPPFSTPEALLSERDGPSAPDRQIPELLLLSQHSLKTPENQESERPKGDVHTSYFTVIANPEIQPDDMHDYALLDEHDDMFQSSLTTPKTTPLLPKAAKPAVTKTSKLNEKTPTGPNSENSLKTSTSRPWKVVNTAARRVNVIQGKSTKRRNTSDNIKRNLRLIPKSQQLKRHKEHKRSPQQDISYVPAFRRRQTATNIYNNVVDHNFAHSALGHTLTDGFVPPTSAFQNIPYNPYSNINPYSGYSSSFNHFSNFPHSQFSPFFGGQFPNTYTMLTSGFPNLAISYPIPLFATTGVFPSYLSNSYNGLNGFNQGSFGPSFHHGSESLGAVSSLFPQFGYPMASNPFSSGLSPVDYPKTFATRNDVRQKNGTNVRNVYNELDSLNGFSDIHRHRLNGGLQPNSHNFMQTFHSPLNPQLPLANPLFPTSHSNPSTTALNNQLPFMPSNPHTIQSALSPEMMRPVFRDNTGLVHPVIGSQNGPFLTPEAQSSVDDDSEMPPIQEKTISNETPITSTESSAVEDDAQRFKPLNGKVEERPNAKTTDEKSVSAAENPQNKITSSVPLETDAPNYVKRPGTTLQLSSRASAQDRVFKEEPPRQAITYLGNSYLSKKPLFMTFFYPKNQYEVSRPQHHRPPMNLNYPGFSINDPQLLHYVKARQEAHISLVNVDRNKKGKKFQQECIDLFGNKLEQCKFSNLPSKPYQRPDYSPEPNLSQPYFDVLNGGIYEDNDHRQQHHLETFNHQPPFHHQLESFHHQPPPPPQTIPLSQLQPIILSQSHQGGWRPIHHTPLPVKNQSPIYNRHQFQELTLMDISPHRHPANRKP